MTVCVSVRACAAPRRGLGRLEAVGALLRVAHRLGLLGIGFIVVAHGEGNPCRSDAGSSAEHGAEKTPGSTPSLVLPGRVPRARGDTRGPETMSRCLRAGLLVLVG